MAGLAVCLVRCVSEREVLLDVVRALIGRRLDVGHARVMGVLVKSWTDLAVVLYFASGGGQAGDGAERASEGRPADKALHDIPNGVHGPIAGVLRGPKAGLWTVLGVREPRTLRVRSNLR